MLCHITGASVAYKKSIKLDFMGEDDVGVFSAHTCSNTIVFPRGCFADTSESFALFKVAMKSLISSPPSFNIA